jgi:DNA-binding CsgD family transcriptional regulator
VTTTSLSTATASRLQADIERLCHRGLDGRTLLEAVAHRIRATVACDALLFLRTDPTTILPTGGVVEALPPGICQRFWDNELLEGDYNTFVELARREATAATLCEATGGDLSRSRRATAIYRPLGLGDELRVSFTARDGSCWGIAALVRAAGTPFAEWERDLLAAVSPTVAEGLRAALVVERPMRSPLSGPALVVLGADGAISATSAEADYWLAELVRGSSTGMSPVPEPVYLAAARARAGQRGVGDEAAWAQVRTDDGVWLHLHASRLHGQDGSDGAVAVMITPARASDLAPLIALGYRLTAREQEVLQFLARGLTTAEMAHHLGISGHTVRDHIKALFQKVGVRSRAELVARVFADHYFDRLEASAHPLTGDALDLSYQR